MSQTANNLEPWFEARRRFKLSHVQIQMARELGMNPKKLGKLDNHKQERWKARWIFLTLIESDSHFASDSAGHRRVAGWLATPLTLFQMTQHKSFVIIDLIKKPEASQRLAGG